MIGPPNLSDALIKNKLTDLRGEDSEGGNCAVNLPLQNSLLGILRFVRDTGEERSIFPFLRDKIGGSERAVYGHGVKYRHWYTGET